MTLFNKEQVELPDGHVVTVRELSLGQLQEADLRQTESLGRLMRALPEKIVENEMERSRIEQQANRSRQRLMEYQGYDADTLLEYGIVSWDYDEPCDAGNKKAIGGTKGEQLARRIFELSVIPEGEGAPSSANSNGAASREELPAPIASLPREGS